MWFSFKNVERATCLCANKNNLEGKVKSNGKRRTVVEFLEWLEHMKKLVVAENKDSSSLKTGKKVDYVSTEVGMKVQMVMKIQSSLWITCVSLVK